MTALVVPRAMTTRTEIIRKKKVTTLIAGVILVSMVCVLMSMSLAPRDLDVPLYSGYKKDVVYESQGVPSWDVKQTGEKKTRDV